MSFHLIEEKQKIQPKPEHIKDWEWAVNRLAENCSEKIPDRAALCMLYEVYVEGEDPSEIAHKYANLYKVQKSYAARIVSKKSGWDTSRKPLVRGVFKSFLHKIGMESPFVEYGEPKPKDRTKFNSPHHRKDRHAKSSKGLGLLKDD